MFKFVTLTTFDNAIEAHIVKNLLESEQLAVYLIGEHFFGAQSLLNVGLAHIRMQVPNEHLIQAKQLLVDYKQGTLMQPLIEEFGLAVGVCNKCGSNEVSEVSASPSKIFGALLQIFFIGLVLPPPKYQICKQCKFKIQED